MVNEKYHLIRKIGQGGMAVIYLASDKKTRDLVAIKVVKQEKINNIYKKRFLSEMRTLKSLDSPYIVKFFDGKYEKNDQYMVMEYVEGKVFKEYLKEKTRLAPEEVVHFGKQLARGFFEIHQKGIIHRDIKSSNIIISKHNQVKIIDFGIALRPDITRVTKENVAIGSPHYMAPEIVEQRDPTVQSDIYSLGILLFEMIVGDTPFKDKNSTNLALMHVKENVPQVNKLVVNCPQSLSNIVTKATSKNLAFRYKTMIEVYNDLVTCFDESRNNEKPLKSNGKIKKNIFEVVSGRKFGIIIGVVFAFVIGLLIGLLFFFLN